MKTSKFDKLFKLVMEEIKQFGLNQNNKNNPNISVKDYHMYNDERRGTIQKNKYTDGKWKYKSGMWRDDYPDHSARLNYKTVARPLKPTDKVYTTDKNISVKGQLKDNPTVKLDENLYRYLLSIIGNISDDKLKSLSNDYADDIKKQVIQDIKLDEQKDTKQLRLSYCKGYLDSLFQDIYLEIDDLRDEFYKTYEYSDAEKIYDKVYDLINFENYVLNNFPQLKDHYDQDSIDNYDIDLNTWGQR